ncbi:Uma2 family endonuclease [Streptomyces sp. NPDC001435]|uniref:Uma2 family endonuclease n=1 Tax=unclassified Streptomyces TaxID=2593676 RepID=UPI0036AD624B
MSPSPGEAHQRASRRLAALLQDAVDRAGQPLEVLEAVNMVVPDGMLIPDIVVADADAAAAAGLSIDAHDVVLVVEIASPSTRVTDRKMMHSLYATAGIPHYWCLELEPAPHLYCGMRHSANGYTDLSLTAGQVTEIAVPFPVAIDPARLLR